MKYLKSYFSQLHRRLSFALFLLCLIVVGLTASKLAYAQVIDSIHYDWLVYEYSDVNNEKEGKICYILSFPKSSNSSYTAKRTPYLSITRFALTQKEEVAVYGGYEYKLNSPVYILLSSQQFKLFTDNDMAWASHEVLDKQIIQLMLQSNYIKVRSDSSLGNYSVDIYSTKGLTRAYSRMKQLCS